MTYEEMRSRFDNEALGPIGYNDAILLASVLDYAKPGVAVEYGSLEGGSAVLISPRVRQLYCVDPNPGRGLYAVAEKHKNILIAKAPMEEWSPPEDTEIDFVFFDAAHDCQKSLKAMELISRFLTMRCILAVHDTGIWPVNLPPGHASFISGRTAQTHEERKFCNELVSRGWQSVSFANETELRHGITLLQIPQW